MRLDYQDQLGLEDSQDHKDLKDKGEKVDYQDHKDREENLDQPDLLVRRVSVETLDLLDLQVLPDREEHQGHLDNQVTLYLLHMNSRNCSNVICVTLNKIPKF